MLVYAPLTQKQETFYKAALDKTLLDIVGDKVCAYYIFCWMFFIPDETAALFDHLRVPDCREWKCKMSESNYGLTRTRTAYGKYLPAQTFTWL